MTSSKLLNKNSLVFTLKFVLYFTLFFLFAKAKILATISPVFYGFYLCLIFMGERMILTSSSFLLASSICDASTFSLIFYIFTVISACIIGGIYRKSSHTFSLWKKFLYTLFIGLPYIYFNSTSLSSLYICPIDVLLNALFAFACCNFVKVMISRHFSLSLNVDEVFCLCLFLAVLFLSLQSVNFFPFDIVRFVGFSVLLLSSVLLPSSFLMLSGVVMGLGAFLCNSGVEYLAIFTVSSSFCFVFKSQSRIFSALSVIMIDIALNLFVSLSSIYSPLTFIATVVASAIFVLLPSKFVQSLKNILYVDREGNSLKNILNQTRLKTSKRLLYTAEVFYEMDKSFRKLVKGGIDTKTAKNMLCSEIIRENCENCQMKNKCMRNFTLEHKKVLENLVDVGFEKGKITLLDLSPYLTNRCGKLNQLIISINSLLSDYQGYCKMNRELDNSKILVAEQLRGISHVLTQLSLDTKEVTTLDHKMEKKIKENLTYHDIVPTEVVCFEKDEKTSIVSLQIRNVDYDNERIEKVLSKCMKRKMVLDESIVEGSDNLMFVSYKTAPAYSIAVGVARENKGGNENSGDTHSLIKLGDDKFMLALCDGMGSGKTASEKSETSINIIENFYRAGYDDETIISSVNKLLNLTSENVFSALDISVIDLKNGQIDFIKQGATVGYIKSQSEVHKIESNSLPLGVLSEVSPRHVKTMLSADDEVIMLSDGIVDAIGEEVLTQYLVSLSIKNPQEVADKVLQKAMSICHDYPTDDMTVIVGKIFFNAS